MTLGELKRYIEKTSARDLYAPDDDGKNIFDKIASCSIVDKEVNEALISLRNKDRKLFFNSQKIPDWFFIDSVASSKTSASPAAKFNPVAATLGGEPFGATVASAPSSKKAKKSLILSADFFAVGAGKFRDQVLARRIEQINKLRGQEGFAIYYKGTDGAFNLLDIELQVDNVTKLTNFSDDDYEIFCQQFRAIARDDTIILDEIKARELNTLFYGRYQYLSDSIDVQAQLGYSKLRAVVELNDIDEVRAILDKNPASLKSDVDLFGAGPLNCAARYGHEKILEVLLKNGAEVNKAHNRRLTPLHEAAHYGHEKIVEVLLKNGAEVNIADNQGWTPLNNAAINGQEKIVKDLLDSVNDKEVRLQLISKDDNNGCNLLLSAALYGHEKIVKDLLDFVDVDRRFKLINEACKVGASPLQLAAWNGHEKTVKALVDSVSNKEEKMRLIKNIEEIAKIRFTSGEVGDSDKKQKGRQTFNMGNIGQPLNSTNVPKIRDSIKKVCGNKQHQLLKVKKPQQYKRVANFQNLVQDSINKSHYSGRDSQQDGEFHLLHYHDKSEKVKKGQDRGKYLTKLLSVHCQDELQAISVNNNAKILGIFQDEDGFYHVTTNKPCRLSYVLNIPPQQQQSEVSNENLQQLITDYKNIRDGVSTKADTNALEYKGKKYSDPGDIQFPRNKYHSNQEWLEDIYRSGGGACRDRVKAFDYKAKKRGISADSYRIVGINNNHVAIEVKNKDGTWQYHDLGGRDSKLVNSGKNLRQSSNSVARKFKKSLLVASFPVWALPWYAGRAVYKTLRKARRKRVIVAPVQNPVFLEEDTTSLQEGNVSSQEDTTSLQEGNVSLSKSNTQQLNEQDNNHSNLLDNVNQFLTTNSSFEAIDSTSKIARSSNGKSLLVTGGKTAQAANKLIFDARKGRAVFYLDDPGKIDIFTNVISLQELSNPQVMSQGFLSDFLSKSGRLQPLILVNWDAFTPKQQVALNTMLDDRASIQGRNLDNIQIVSLVSKEPTDQSFLSRHQQQLKLAADVDLELPSPEFDPTAGNAKVVVIDFEGHANWRQKLFGDIKLSKGKLEYQQSTFVDLLSQGKYSFEFKNISAEAKAELQYQLQQAKAFGYFSYQGRQIEIPANMVVKFDSKSFDFTQFAQPNTIKITNDVDISQLEVQGNNKNHIINTRNFDKLLHGKDIDGQDYTQTPGIIELSKAGELNIFITSQLSAAQYYCLFNQAKKHDVKLNLNLAPNAEIPKDIASDLKVQVTMDQEQKIPSSSSSSKDPRSVAKITVTNNANKHLQTLAINPGTIILDIEDYSYADLVEKIDYTLTDGQFKFSKTTSKLITELAKGRPVILKGQISEELLLDLQEVLLQHPNLTIINEERDIELQEVVQQFSWLGTGAVQVKKYDKSKRTLPPIVIKEDDTLGDHPEPKNTMTGKNPRQIEAQAVEFIDKRRQILRNMVKKSPIVRLTGPSGVGKSSLLRDLHQDGSNNIKVYNELSSLATWSQDQDPAKQKTLFIDEANIDDMHYTMFAPLLRAAATNTWPATILYDGQLIELTKQHKVVFAGNPITYGGGRSEQKLFTDYQVPTFEMQDFRAEYIYQKLLKEAIFDKVNLEEPMKQQLQQGFLTKCQGLVLKYLQVNARARKKGEDSQAETVRELQGYALDYLAATITKSQKLTTTVIKSDSYITTAATKPIEEQINKCLTIRKLQQQGLLPVATGLGGIFLEGGSGIGKSSIIEAMIQDEDHIKIDASTPSQQKIELLTQAFEQGKIVQIDELNSSIDDGLEKALNAVLTGHHPETGAKATTPGFLLIASANKASMAGRSIVSPALRHRMYCPKVPELTNFKQQDIETMVNHWHQMAATTSSFDEIVPASQQNITKQQISEKFHQAIQEGTSNLRDLKQAMTKINKDPHVVVQGQKSRPSGSIKKPTLEMSNIVAYKSV